jgi:hypothetical protein
LVTHVQHIIASEPESDAAEREDVAEFMAAAQRLADRIPHGKVAKGLLGPLFPSKEERRRDDEDR